MPNQKRWTIKRNLDFAAGNCDQAITNIVKAGHEFETVHPDIYAQFAIMASALDAVKHAIISLRDRI